MKPDNHVDSAKKAELEKLLKKLDTQLDTVKNDLDVIRINKTLDEIETIEPIAENKKISKEYMMKLFEEELLDEGLRRREERLAQEASEKKALQKDKKPVFTFKFARYAVVACLVIGIFAVTAIGNYETLNQNTSTDEDWVVFTNEDDFIFEYPDDTLMDTSYTSIEQVKEELGFDFYFPSQYEDITDIEVVDTGGYYHIFFFATWEEKEVGVRIVHMKSADSNLEDIVEKSNDYEISSVNGIKYYIIPNMNWCSAIFSDDFNSYIFEGFDSAEDATRFIDTLKKY